jgi:hypothetical protein
VLWVMGMTPRPVPAPDFPPGQDRSGFS